MNISYNWLKEYVNFDLTPDETAEGAGYAGGIVSAAVDGLRCAEAVLRQAP